MTDRDLTTKVDILTYIISILRDHEKAMAARASHPGQLGKHTSVGGGVQGSGLPRRRADSRAVGKYPRAASPGHRQPLKPGA